MPWFGGSWHPAMRVYRPVHGRLASGALGLISAGGGFFFGWGLVKEGGNARMGDSPYRLPAPDWLPIAGTVLVAAGVLLLVVVHLSAPLSTGERLPEHLRRPVDERTWPLLAAIFGPFAAAMLITSIAATESSDRWEPVLYASLFGVLAIPMVWWLARTHRP